MRELLTTVASFAPNYWATLALGALCAYLGIFTVLRRIVFTGAALAQAAAAGVAGSFWVLSLPLPRAVLDAVAHWGATIGSLGTSVVSALALARTERRGRVTADAMVGVVFAASSALAVLFVWRSSKGLVELKNILAGDVMLSSSSDLKSLWFGVAAVALLHAVYRSRFLLIAYDPPFARAQGLNVKFLERVFLASLAVAVALALRAAGLMLVFGTLVLPPLVGLRVARTLGRATWMAIAAAWTSALLGFLLATDQNLPVAPTIVCCEAALFGAALLIPRAVGLLCVVGGVAALVVGASLGAFAPQRIGPSLADGVVQSTAHGDEDEDEDSMEHELEERIEILEDFSVSEEQRALAADELVGLAHPDAVGPLLEAMGDPDPGFAEHVRGAAVALVAGTGGEVLLRLLDLAENSDPELSTHAARVLVEIQHAGAWSMLVERLGDPEVPMLLRDETHAFLTTENDGEGLGYDAFAEPSENAEALDAWRAWAKGR